MSTTTVRDGTEIFDTDWGSGRPVVFSHGIRAFSETDFTGDLRKFDVPTLVIHGDDDQIVPIGASAHAASKLIRNATLKIYPGGSHGLPDTHGDELNADLLAFLDAER